MKVLVIDDSAFNRRALARIIGSISTVGEVVTAVDGIDGYRQAMSFDPDLIVLDLEMPNLDGMSFLRLRSGFLKDVPVIVASGRRAAGDCETALRLGAAGFIERPTSGPSNRIFDITGELAEKISAAGELREAGSRAFKRRRRPLRPALTDYPSVVAIGASTGGPGPVSEIVRTLPLQLASAIVISVHMPEWMTVSFAERLNSICAVEVKVASHGDPVRRSGVLVAPGGFDISFERDRAGIVRTVLEKRHSAALCSPSIDAMFASASTIWGSGLVGVVLTGMGEDGSRGVGAIKQRGGMVIAESRASSPVFSMPRAAIATGTVDLVLTSGEIARWIGRMCAPRPLKLA